MRRFDYTFLEKSFLPVNMLSITNLISEFKALQNARKEKHKNIFVKLESVAKVQSVKSSNAIEGIITSDKRINEIVNKSSAPLNHSETEIAGYRDALNIIHEGHQYLKIDEREILRLHEILLSYTNSETEAGYKKEDNVILEIDESGRRSVRFTPTPAIETKETMEQLMLAYLDASNNGRINNLLLIPCFILDFLCIHPFSDGNGRMSRLLSLLLLYKNGYDAGKYISFEEQINKNKGEYYESLRKSSVGWGSNQNDYMPFIENFIFTLLVCYKELDLRFAVINNVRISKKTRVEATVLNSLLPISKKEISDILPDVSISTIEVILSYMVKKDKIIKIGNYKDAKYLKI